MSNSLNSMIVVYNAQGRLDGEIIKSFLEANEIRVILIEQGANSAYCLTIGELGLVEILVDLENEEKARQLLAEMDNGELEIEEDLPDDEDN